MTNQQEYDQLLTNCAIAAKQLKEAKQSKSRWELIVQLEAISHKADQALDDFQGGENFSDDFLNS